MIRYLIKLLYLLGALVIIIGLSGCGDPGTTRGDEFLARVGGRVITVLDFNKAFEITRMAYPLGKMQNPAIIREARIRLLEQMIEEMVVLESAGELNLQISGAEFEKAISDVKGEYPDDVFEKMLLENAISYSYWKSRLKTRLLMEKVISQELSAQVRITPEDVSAYYEEHFKGRDTATASEAHSKDTDKKVIDHLRWQKTEKAYKEWIEKQKQKQTIEINGAQWKMIISS